jgi:O-antigen ligase
MKIYGSQIQLFLLGALLSQQINLVGVLTVSEVICFLYFIAFGKDMMRYAMQEPLFRWFALAWGGLLLMQATSDLVNGIAMSEIKRGWARTVFLAINTLVIAHMSRFRLDRIVAFFFGYLLSLLIGIWLLVNPYLALWKFGYGGAVTLFLALAMGMRTSRNMNYAAALAFLLLGLFHFKMNARLLGGMSLFTGMTAFFSGYLYSERQKRPVSAGLFIGLMLISAVGILQLYKQGVTSGVFGEVSREKYLKQTADGRNVLLGGRSEYMFSLPAILEKPVLGHGSFARNVPFLRKYIDINRIDLNAWDTMLMLELEVIPTHSHILGAWVESGFMGALFWLLILFHACRLFIRVLRQLRMPYRLFCLYVIALFIWDLVFSPFGMERRVINAAMFVLLVALTRYFRTEAAAARPVQDMSGTMATRPGQPLWQFDNSMPLNG